MSTEATDDRRIWLAVTGILLVTMPALTLFVAYAVLSATRSVLLEQITLVEAVELYLVELLAFAVFSYLLYRLTSYSIKQHDTPQGADEGDQHSTDRTGSN